MRDVLLDNDIELNSFSIMHEVPIRFKNFLRNNKKNKLFNKYNNIYITFRITSILFYIYILYIILLIWEVL